MKKNNNSKIVLIYFAVIVILLLSTSAMFGGGRKIDKAYSEVISYFENGEVKTFTISDSNLLTIKLKDENKKEITYQLRYVDLFFKDIDDYRADVEAYDIEPPEEISWWVSFIPYVIVIVAIIAVWIFFMKQASGGMGGRKIASFGKSRAKLASDDKKKVYFSDVAGADEEKEELSEIVDFLKDPTKFSALGAKIPHGVLLMGPPGTGKTLLAKAVAGEANVPFYSISGSDFVEMYVGVGASRVRDLFETAKKHAPGIIFIDEIDAVGRHRGAGLGGGNDEREQTLNQLLVEMDGFGSTEGIIVIAATNRPDILDPALLRPGRFDRQITVNYPDIKGREEILKVHAKGKPFESNVDLAILAQTTAGFTGADLANLLNEAALLAARKGKKLIGMEELEDATIKVIVGPKKKSRIIKDSEKRATAYHEAGHAIVTKIVKPEDPVRQISIIPSGMALGYTLSLPKEDKYSVYRKELESEIAILLGGRVAEKLILKDISGGAANDIQRATEIARKMVTQYGMSDLLGPIVYGTGHDEVFLGKEFSSQRNYSETVAAEIDSEIKRIINSAFETAEKILTENMDKLHFVAGYLAKNEIMDEEQFAAAMNGATEEELDRIKADKVQKSKSQNDKKRDDDLRREAEEAKKKEEEAKEKLESLDTSEDIKPDNTDNL